MSQEPLKGEEKNEDRNLDRSLEDIDAFLTTQDPQFSEFVGKLSAEKLGSPGEQETLETLVIDESSLEGADDWVDPAEKAFALKRPRLYPWVKFYFDWRRRWQRWKIRLRQRVNRSLLRIYEFVTEDTRLFASALKRFALRVLAACGRLLSSFLSLTLLQKFCLILAILFFGASFYLVKKTYEGGWLPTFKSGPMTNLLEYADQKETFDPDQLEPFLAGESIPEFVVQIGTIKANLRRMTESETPMALFEFYLEGDSQEAAVEIKRRENEFRDLIQRGIEGFTYDEIESVRGKSKLKYKIQQALTARLNNGYVKEVYIKNVVIKP